MDMDNMSFGSGDKIKPLTDALNIDERPVKDDTILQPIEDCGDKNYENVYKENDRNDELQQNNEDNIVLPEKDNDVLPNNCYIGSSIIDNNETMQLKEACSNVNSKHIVPDVTDRITECKNIIASLKLELNDERNKLENELLRLKTKPELESESKPIIESGHELEIPCEETNSMSSLADLSYPTNFFTASVDTRLYSDRNLIEYEKQLQKYQRTLNMAQNAKKNAIRKQMLAKAFKLKLLEVENQCNIELLRVKQNLQCLEPLKMIAETWKTEKDGCDLSQYDLIPLFPEIYVNAGSDIISTDADDTDLEQIKNTK